MSASTTAPDPVFTPWRGNPSDQLQRIRRDLEVESSVIRWFEPDLVPGLLQTRDYLREVLEAVIGFVDDAADDDAVTDAIAARLERQERWREAAPSTAFVIAESALTTIVGTPAITRGQLEALLLPLPEHATLAVVPRSTQFRFTATGFTIFDDREVRVETITGGMRFVGPDVAGYQKAFNALSGDAVTGPDAHALIREAIAVLG
ncbi:Scr1 family TA system antitoxin-like transcriptional regulator [Nocardia puris]|uniref:DUF5753 domain-containing protein n=1 Tax=Nocardia puris TaxID=208602 RepID=A0A366DPZ3_9NOCA|nr:Scr1 family TA system antitoxin-like transcriptional regulator [Nocardia puris]RBO91344.1 hypothetical protein DFR74_10446 [Nocardia puris]